MASETTLGSLRTRHSAIATRQSVESIFKHPLTDIGLERFLKDWEKAQAAKV